MSDNRKLTKVVRLDLRFVDTEELDYKSFCSAAFEIQKQIRSAKNALSSRLYFDLLHEKELERGYKKDGTQKSSRSACYDLCVERIPNLNSGNVNAVSDKVYQAYSGKEKRRDLYIGAVSALTYKGGQPIDLRNQSISTFYDNGQRMLRINFFSLSGKKALDLKTGEIVFRVVNTKEYQNAIFDRCVSGEYAVAGSVLMYNNKKKSWYINLGYTFTPEQVELDPSKILGVDVGEAKPFYAATDTGWDVKFVSGSKIENFRRQVEERRRDMRRSAVYNGGGHGRKKRMAVVDKLSSKIENFRNTTNFTYAKAIVDFAIQQGCGTIQMEDLSGISANNKFLKNWSYFDLQTKVEHKALERGLIFRKIDPQYTSQRCHRCGWIDKASRPSQSEFVCTKCGHKDNADRNAARNIAIEGIEKIIKQQCKLQGLYYRDKKKKVAELEVA